MDWHDICEIGFVLILLFIACSLSNTSKTLGRIEQNFSTIQELQKEVKRLDKLTQCLEPARK